MITIYGCWIGYAPHGHTWGETVINNCHHRTAGGPTEVNWMLTSSCNLCNGISGATVAGHSTVKTLLSILTDLSTVRIYFSRNKNVTYPPPLNMVTIVGNNNSLQWLKLWRYSNTQTEKLNLFNYKYLERGFESHPLPQTLPQYLHIAPTAMATVQIGKDRERQTYGRESGGTRNRKWLCWQGPTTIYATNRWPCRSSDSGFSQGRLWFNPRYIFLRFRMEQKTLEQVVLYVSSVLLR
jgi:hypothetical protein